MRQRFLSLLGGLLIASEPFAAASTVPGYITAAVADTARPAADTQRDVNRKPAEVLAFAGVKPGDHVVEFLPGSGYYTQLLCRIVGSKGHVDAISFTRKVAPPQAPPPAPAIDACSNIERSTVASTGLKLPVGLDLVWTSENYHDLNNDNYGPADLQAFNKAVFDALKPGGVYLIEDHAAAAGSGARDTSTLHRIDAERVKQDMLAVGFVLDGSSELLHRSDDPHTSRAHLLEGKTDKFLLKFRKPTH